MIIPIFFGFACFVWFALSVIEKLGNIERAIRETAYRPDVIKTDTYSIPAAELWKHPHRPEDL